MPVIRVLGSVTSSPPSTEPPGPFIIPAGPPIPFGHQIIAICFTLQEEGPGWVNTITDSRGNIYYTDMGGASNFLGVVRGQILHALQPGDQINVFGWEACLFLEVTGIFKSNRVIPGVNPGGGEGPVLPDPVVDNWSNQAINFEFTGRPNTFDARSSLPGIQSPPIGLIGSFPELVFALDLNANTNLGNIGIPDPPAAGGVPASPWVALPTVLQLVSFPIASPPFTGYTYYLLTAYYQVATGSGPYTYFRDSAGSFVAEMLAYHRGSAGGVACLCQKTQEFIVARPDSDGNDLDVLKSDTIVPPFTNTTVMTGLVEPALDVEFSPSRVLRLLAVDPTGAVVQRRSFDDSESFTEASQVFPAGANPRIRSSRKGHILYAAYIDSGSGIGTISGILQENPNAPLGTPFQFLDEANSNLTFNNAGFDFSYTFEPVERLLMVAQPAGATEYETYQSCDDGQTWIILGT